MWPFDALQSLWTRLFSTVDNTPNAAPQAARDDSLGTRLLVATNAKTLPYGEFITLAYAAPTSFPPSAPSSPSSPVFPISRSQPSHRFLQAVESRRSHYSLSSDSPIPDARIVQLVQHAITHVPSSWNSQSSRAIVLFGPAHLYLWDTILAALAQRTSGAKLAAAEGKIQGAMRSGHGTVLFFEDLSVVHDLQERFATYKDEFAMWSEQTSGMAQLIVWVALQEEGLGVSLQHYNKLIEPALKAHFSLPENWKLIAQMPFGTAVAEPGEKTFQPIEDRVKVFGL